MNREVNKFRGTLESLEHLLKPRFPGSSLEVLNLDKEWSLRMCTYASTQKMLMWLVQGPLFKDH